MGQPHDQPNRQYPPVQVQAPPLQRRPGRGPAAAGLIAGLLIAVVVGGILAVSGVLHFGSASREPARVSSAAIALPDTLPGSQEYVAANKAARAKSSSGSTARTTQILEAGRANSEKVSSLTKAAYQEANPGAAVAFRQYADATGEHQPSVIAVRATYPGLTNGPVLDPAYLKLGVAPQRLQSSARCNACSSAPAHPPVSRWTRSRCTPACVSAPGRR
jgi:hypothetical protein